MDAHGKHLFLRFDGDLTIHSHLRMTGSWGTYASGRALATVPPASVADPSRARPRGRGVRRPGPRAPDGVPHPLRPAPARPRPDICASPFDTERYLRRLREDDPTPTIGDALLDQRTVAGIGNIWKSEACWEAQVDPRRPGRRVTDDEARALVDLVHPADGRLGTDRVRRTGRARLPARRAGRAGAAGRRSAPAGSATTTARHTGARDARGDAPIRGTGDPPRATRRAQGCARARPRQHRPRASTRRSGSAST